MSYFYTNRSFTLRRRLMNTNGNQLSCNPNFKIDITKKTRYHMLCVLANNFTTILWEKVFADFEDKLNIVVCTDLY